MAAEAALEGSQPVDLSQHPSGIVPTLQNIVSTVNLDCQLDLKLIALQARNAEYNPKVCTGAKSEQQSKLAARKYARIIQKLNFPAKFKDFEIQNIVASCDVKFPIRLEGLAYSHGAFASYEPELFPGLIYRMRQPKIVLLIFVSGKIVLTGAKARGESIAKQIGEFIKLDMSGNSRGWGQSLRARIWLDIDEPIQRCIQINTQKRKELIYYPILYEKPPYFCFSCGKLGHSATFCPTPAEGDENGDWPYDASVRASELRKIKKEPGVIAGENPDAGRVRQQKPSQSGPFNFNTHPNTFAGVRANGGFNSDNQGTMHFSASGRGRGGTKPPVNRQLPLGGQMYAPKLHVGPVLEPEVDKQGTKRNALVNSLSNIDGEATDSKKKRATGDSEIDMGLPDDMDANQNLAEDAEQPRSPQ
ncbi:hypothetical protein ACQ4PT_027162 [Festuca glaucescens]